MYISSGFGQCASSFLSGPSLSHKLTGKKKKQKRENQPLPFTVTIYLIKVPESKIITKKCDSFSLPHDREESSLLFSECIINYACVSARNSFATRMLIKTGYVTQTSWYA